MCLGPFTIVWARFLACAGARGGLQVKHAKKKKKKNMYNIYLASPSACRHPWCLVTWWSFGPWLLFIAGVLAAAL